MATVPFRSKTSAARLVEAMQKNPQAPLSAMIEIADRCNEVCVHCYQIQGLKGEMSTEEIYKILDELAKMGVLFLTISGGEATLRKDFLDIVAYARKKQFAVKIFTNGLTMTAELARKLAELAVQEVQISLYSQRAEIHDSVTGVLGSFQKTVAGICNLRAENVPVVAKTPLMAMNVGQYQEYIDFVVSLGADYMMDPGALDAREDGDLSPQALNMEIEDLRTVLKDPRLAPPEEKVATVPLESTVCGACSTAIHIEAHGEVRPCSQLDVSCGSAKDGVEEAWLRHPNAVAIRNITWADLHGCRDCDLRNYCMHCFAQARASSGDALGPYQEACTRAKVRYEVVHGTAPRFAEVSNSALGPYQEVEKGVFLPAMDVRTRDDANFAEAQTWARTAPGAPPELAGQLVQIRRKPRKVNAQRDHVLQNATVEV